MIFIRPAKKIVGSTVRVIPLVRSVYGSSTSTKYSGSKDSIGSLVRSLAMDHEALDAFVAWDSLPRCVLARRCAGVSNGRCGVTAGEVCANVC